ncbi:MAG: SDR family oxidoreductase [Acidobacteria bacterium]|nr:SDR family oxidoreductase [Acidobacteriota bacterium]
MSLENLFSLKGKTALVVGASRGIGLAIAKEIAAAGAHTVLAARSGDKLAAEAGELKAAGYSADSRSVDIADSDSIAAFAAEFRSSADILVNVAGTNLRRRMQDYTKEEYNRILDTNLHGIFEICQHIGGGMVERGKGGKIIHIGSLMSLLGLPYLSVYAISKAGIAGLTRVQAAEWGPHGIQVNCIAPGFILTDLNKDMWQAEHMHTWLKGNQANPRMGTPADLAGTAVFLASSAADYITGQVIAVDGGYTTTANWPFQPAY